MLLLQTRLKKILSTDRNTMRGRVASSLLWRQWAMLALGVVCLGIKSYDALSTVF